MRGQNYKEVRMHIIILLVLLLETCKIKLLFMLPWQMECLWYDETSRLLSSTFGPTTSIQNTDLG